MNHKFMHVSPPHFQVGKEVGLGLLNIFESKGCPKFLKYISSAPKKPNTFFRQVLQVP